MLNGMCTASADKDNPDHNRSVTPRRPRSNHLAACPSAVELEAAPSGCVVGKTGETAEPQRQTAKVGASEFTEAGSCVDEAAEEATGGGGGSGGCCRRGAVGCGSGGCGSDVQGTMVSDAGPTSSSGWPLRRRMSPQNLSTFNSTAFSKRQVLGLMTRNPRPVLRRGLPTAIMARRCDQLQTVFIELRPEVGIW